tara:strand:+ start:2048 stop:2248 length:201 start_codon:yes stop_codon:yes gene_type:complete
MKPHEYREIVMTHLQYIKEKVDANHEHLLRLNGRVTRNERLISWIIGIGSGVAFILTTFVAYVGYK